MRRLTIPETPIVKAGVAGLCAYETTAIISGLVPSLPTLPTITALHHRWPVIGAAIVVVLAVHFWTPDQITIPPKQ